MIKALVFSKDRALQLQAALESLFLHCMDVDCIQISVLYKCSTAQHIRQYRQLEENWRDKRNVTFVPQTDFRRNALKILNPYPVKSIPRIFFEFLSHLNYRFARLLSFLPIQPVPESFVLFLVDDALFIRDFRIADLIAELNQHSDVLGFSLRLGRNTTHCYMQNTEQRLPTFSTSSDFALKFNWTNGDLDFGYPLEVSSSLYRLDEIFPLANLVPFKNPNELEGNMAVRAKNFAEKQPFLFCSNHSLAFCNPVNVVQTISANRAGGAVSYSSSQLAELFDQGYRIRVETYNNFTPSGCHEEVALDLQQVMRSKDE